MFSRRLLSWSALGLLVALMLATTTPAGASPNYRDVILADNPIMYWRLGESSGSVAYDETANHRDATYIHNPFFGLRGGIRNDPNTAVGFNGFNQYALWAPSMSYSGSYAVEAWVRLRRNPSPDAGPTFFNTRSLIGEYTFDFQLVEFEGIHQVHIDAGDGSQWLWNGYAPFDFQVGPWYHLVAVVTPSGATIYANGGPIGSTSFSGTPLLFDPSHEVQLGTDTRYDFTWFHGKIDEVAVYDYALTADQIAVHYAAGIGP